MWQVRLMGRRAALSRGRSEGAAGSVLGQDNPQVMGPPGVGAPLRRRRHAAPTGGESGYLAHRAAESSSIAVGG